VKSRQAVSIEWLLSWAYRRQRVVEITGRSLSRGEAAAAGERWVKERTTSGDGCVAIYEGGILGRKIDGGLPPRGIAQPLHPDAETVHDAVLEMPWHQAALLINFGRTGLAPEPVPPVRFYRIPERVGGRKVRIRSQYDVDLKCRRRWSCVQPYPDEQVRQMYEGRLQVFRDALEALRDRLRDVELRDYVVVEGPDERVMLAAE
jgi:hypothetical protein